MPVLGHASARRSCPEEGDSLTNRSTYLPCLVRLAEPAGPFGQTQQQLVARVVAKLVKVGDLPRQHVRVVARARSRRSMAFCTRARSPANPAKKSARTDMSNRSAGPVDCANAPAASRTKSRVSGHIGNLLE